MKITTILIIITILVTVLFSYMSYASNRRTERQKYTVTKKEDLFEIRYYPKSIMATVVSPGANFEGTKNNNFRTLAAYIFGGNKENKSIAMTAPVYMEKDGKGSKMSFVLPAQYQLNELPQPKDTSIQVHYSDEGYYAALRFGGFANDKRIEEKQMELLEKLNHEGYEIAGNFKYLGYNAPWDIVNRENDIIVKIAYKN